MDNIYPIDEEELHDIDEYTGSKCRCNPSVRIGASGDMFIIHKPLTEGQEDIEEEDLNSLMEE